MVLYIEYLNTLKKHRKRHEAKGHGFGYVVRDERDRAATLVCGGMGKERNLLKDEKTQFFDQLQRRKTPQNSECIRAFTPLECERLQGFPDNWTEGVSDGVRCNQLSNSVTVFVIEEICKKIIGQLLNPAPCIIDNNLFK